VIEQELGHLAFCLGDWFAVGWAPYPTEEVHFWQVDKIPLVDAGIGTDRVRMRLALVETRT
jgi:hypothetical protein